MTDEILKEDGASPAAGTSTGDIAAFNGRLGSSGGVGGNPIRKKHNDILCGTEILEDAETDPEAYFKNLGDKFKTDDLEVGAGKEEVPETDEIDDDIKDIINHDFSDNFDVNRVNGTDNFSFTSKLFNTSFVLPQADLIEPSDTKPNEVDVFPSVNIALSNDGIKEAIRLASLMQKKELPIDATPSPEYISAKRDAYELENGIDMPKLTENAYSLVFKIAKSIFLGKNADYVKGGFRLKEDVI
jgi:hypothetical protein